MRIEGLNNTPDIKKLERQNKRVQEPKAANVVVPADTVEISPAARSVDSVNRLPDVRLEKVAALRSEIEKGTYITPEKLDKALDNLLKDIF